VNFIENFNGNGQTNGDCNEKLLEYTPQTKLLDIFYLSTSENSIINRKVPIFLQYEQK